MIPIPRLSYILVREVLCPVAPGDNCTRSTAERPARSPSVRFSEVSRKKLAETPGYRQRILSLGQFSLLSLGSFRFIIHCRFIETLSGSQCAPTSRRGDLALWVHHFGLSQLVFPLFPLRPAASRTKMDPPPNQKFNKSHKSSQYGILRRTLADTAARPLGFRSMLDIGPKGEQSRSYHDQGVNWPDPTVC